MLLFILTTFVQILKCVNREPYVSRDYLPFFNTTVYSVVIVFVHRRQRPSYKMSSLPLIVHSIHLQWILSTKKLLRDWEGDIWDRGWSRLRITSCPTLGVFLWVDSPNHPWPWVGTRFPSLWKENKYAGKREEEGVGTEDKFRCVTMCLVLIRPDSPISWRGMTFTTRVIFVVVPVRLSYERILYTN